MTNILKIIYLISLFFLPGCAISYIDKQGGHHILGFTNISLSGTDDDTINAGDRVEIKNYGLLLFKSNIYSGIGFGINKETRTSIKNNVLILDENIVDGKGEDND